MTEAFAVCPRCASPLIDGAATGGSLPRPVCPDRACGFVQRRNPTPAVGALVELDGEIILRAMRARRTGGSR